MDAAQTEPALFFSRSAAHFCAFLFVFLPPCRRDCLPPFGVSADI